MDIAVWYLVLELAAESLAPAQSRSPLVGPVTEAQCRQARNSIAELPPVLSANCRKAVGMTTVGNGPVVYARPVFEGEFTGVVQGTPQRAYTETSNLPPFTPRH